MKTIMVRYKTKAAAADENMRLIQAVFAELLAQAPAGVRYATYRLADGVSFVHIATVETPGNNPLTNLPAFKVFVKEIADRCVEQPEQTELMPLHSYG